VSEADLHQRERPGTFPFNMEGKVLTLRFKTLFSESIVPQALVEDKFKIQIVHFHLLDPKIEPKEAKTLAGLPVPADPPSVSWMFISICRPLHGQLDSGNPLA
jgi:hypothetical protein